MVDARPAWRDPAAYRPLLYADRSTLAWEWLRRDPAYLSAALARRPDRAPADPDAHRFGLHRFEDPLLAAPLAHPMWRKEAHPLVIEADAERNESGPDTLHLPELGERARVVEAADGYRLLISDGLHSVRIDIATSEPADVPLLLRYRLSGIASVGPALGVLRRFTRFMREGCFPERESDSNRRHVLLLRAADALSEGAGQREIAAVLLDPDAASPRWRMEQPSLRLRAQRLVRGARAKTSGAYWKLLR